MLVSQGYCPSAFCVICVLFYPIPRLRWKDLGIAPDRVGSCTERCWDGDDVICMYIYEDVSGLDGRWKRVESFSRGFVGGLPRDIPEARM